MNNGNFLTSSFCKISIIKQFLLCLTTILLIITFSSCRRKVIIVKKNSIKVSSKSNSKKDDGLTREKEDVVVYEADSTWECGLPLSKKNTKSLVIRRVSYTLSYNQETLLPNWVMWKLTKEHTSGKEKRLNNYIVDDDIKCPKQLLQDWENSFGYDHGHMCPAGDNKWDKKAMFETFYLSNMCPQKSRLNQETWQNLE